MKKLPILRSKAATALTIAACILAAASAVFFIRNKDTLTLKEPLTISIMGESQSFYGTTRLVYDKDSKEVTLKNGDRAKLLSGIPVYKKEGGGVILSRAMTYTNYETGLIRRLNHFGRAGYDGQIASLSTDGKKEQQVNGGYLYDGKNGYLFLEPVTVTWEDQELSLPPLSYAAVFNKQGFYYYDAEQETGAYIVSGGAVVSATDRRDTFCLNMSNDIVDLTGGTSLLLPPDPGSFPLF